MDISFLRERQTATSLTVTELNSYIKNLIDSDRNLSAVTVTGEISNLTDHRSGHLYFTLKDIDSQIKAVMFRSSRQRLKFMPEEGMKVTVHGSVSVYSQGGSVQLYANNEEDPVDTVVLKEGNKWTHTWKGLAEKTGPDRPGAGLRQAGMVVPELEPTQHRFLSLPGRGAYE